MTPFPRPLTLTGGPRGEEGGGPGFPAEERSGVCFSGRPGAAQSGRVRCLGGECPVAQLVPGPVAALTSGGLISLLSSNVPLGRGVNDSAETHAAINKPRRLEQFYRLVNKHQSFLPSWSLRRGSGRVARWRHKTRRFPTGLPTKPLIGRPSPQLSPHGLNAERNGLRRPQNRPKLLGNIRLLSGAPAG